MKNYIEQKQTYLRDIKSCPKSEQCHYDDDCDGTKSSSKYDSGHGCPDQTDQANHTAIRLAITKRT